MPRPASPRVLVALALALTACGSRGTPPAVVVPASERPDAPADGPDLPERGDASVVLVGYGARVALAAPTAVVRIGDAAGPNAARWDLITACVRGDKLGNAYVAARMGAAPVARPPAGRTLDAAGVADVRRGPDTEGWQVATQGVVFPFVDLPMYAVSVRGATEAILPVQFVTGVWFDDAGPFPGAHDTMLTIVGPLRRPPSPAELTAPDQRVVAQDLSGTPRWLENAYTHGGIAWRQRLYWSADGRFVVRYQAREDRAHDQALLRSAAEQIVAEIRTLAP